MGSLTNFGENALMNHWTNTAYTPPATLYLALATADPTDAATGASMNEIPNANGYSRKVISFGVAATRRVTQDAIVQYDIATGAWGTATHWAIVDNATHGAGNALAHGALNQSYPIVLGNTPEVVSGAVYVEIGATVGGAGFSDYLVHNLLDLMFNNDAFARPDTYLAFSATALDDQDVAAANFTEITGTDYARALVNENGGASPTWDTVSGGSVDNAADVVFPNPGVGGWDEFESLVIIDVATLGSGNVLGYDNNIGAQTANEGDTVQFPAGSLVASLS